MPSSTFEQAFKKHLVPSQRREILDTLRATLRRETTLGEIVDAADRLGWTEAMGELRLSDLADALLADSGGDGEATGHGADLAAGEAHEGESLAREVPAAPPGRARARARTKVARAATARAAAPARKKAARAKPAGKKAAAAKRSSRRR